MFDTSLNQITYTNRNFTAASVSKLLITNIKQKYYLFAFTSDNTLQLFSFPNPRQLEQIEDIKSFTISNEGLICVLTHQLQFITYNIKEGLFSAIQKPIYLKECEEIMAACMDKVVIKIKGRL